MRGKGSWNLICVTLTVVIQWDQHFLKDAWSHENSDFTENPQAAEWADKRWILQQCCLEECSRLQKSLGVDAGCLLQLPASARLGWQKCSFHPRHSLTEEFPLSICWKLYRSEPDKRCAAVDVGMFHEIYAAVSTCLYFSFTPKKNENSVIFLHHSNGKSGECSKYTKHFRGFAATQRCSCLGLVLKRKNHEKTNIKLLYKACLETPRSQIDLKILYLYPF